MGDLSPQFIKIFSILFFKVNVNLISLFLLLLNKTAQYTLIIVCLEAGRGRQ